MQCLLWIGGEQVTPVTDISWNNTPYFRVFYY